MDSRNIKINLKRNGLIIVISGPSGVGKNTIKNGIFRHIKSRIKFSVSNTTRPKRERESEGIDYYFINREMFFEMIRNDHFVEWTEVHQNFYGTTRKEIDKSLVENYDLLMDVDIVGCKKIKILYPESITIFIMPPSFLALEERLKKRGVDNLDLRIRLLQAEKEIIEAKNYDYIIMNDEINVAINDAVSIIQAERCRTSRLKIDFDKGE